MWIVPTDLVQLVGQGSGCWWEWYKWPGHHCEWRSPPLCHHGYQSQTHNGSWDQWGCWMFVGWWYAHSVRCVMAYEPISTGSYTWPVYYSIATRSLYTLRRSVHRVSGEYMELNWQQALDCVPLLCTQSHTMSCGKKIIGGSALVMVGHWSTLVLHSSWLVPTGEQFTWRVQLWRGEGGGLQTPFLELNQDINTFPFHRSISSSILLTSVPGNTIHRSGLQNWCMPHT